MRECVHVCVCVHVCISQQGQLISPQKMFYMNTTTKTWVESPTVTLTWHVSEYKVHKPHCVYWLVGWLLLFFVSLYFFVSFFKFFTMSMLLFSFCGFCCCCCCCFWGGVYLSQITQPFHGPYFYTLMGPREFLR